MATPNLIVHGTSIGPVTLLSLGNDLYRFNETFNWGMFADDEEELATLPNPGDVILAKTQASGDLEFIRVYRPGNFRMHCYVLAREDVDNPALDKLLIEVARSGGSWSREMGGLLTVGLPPESSLDFPAALTAALGGALYLPDERP